MRRFAAGILAFVGLLLVPLADAGLWTQRELLTTASFTDLAVDVVRQPEVSDALAQRLTDEIELRTDLPLEAHSVIESAVRTAVGTEQFELIFRAAVGGMHDQLKRGDDVLALNLDESLPVIKSTVAGTDQGIAAEIPDSGLPVITVVTKDDAPALWDAVDVARRASLAFPIAALVLLAAAVLVSPRRHVMLIVIGVGMLAIAVALALLIELGRGPLSDVAGSQLSRDAFDAGYDVVGASFVAQSAVFGVLGVVLAASGGALMWRRSRNRIPNEWA